MATTQSITRASALWASIVAGPSAAVLAAYFTWRAATNDPVSLDNILAATLWLALTAFIVAGCAALWFERRDVADLKAQVKSLVDSRPRIVYVGYRGSLLNVQLNPPNQSERFWLVQLRFKNRPLTRVGEASVARNVSATIEFWLERPDDIRACPSFIGRWASTIAAEHVGFQATADTAVFDANEIPVKLNIALIALFDDRIYAAAEENLWAFKGGWHPTYRLTENQSRYRLCVKLRSNAISQDFWFTMTRRDSDSDALSIEPLSGDIEIEKTVDSLV